MAAVAGTATATAATVPAAAQPYQVTVELPDGSLQPVILDLPPGATLDQVGGLEGTPVAIEPVPVEPPPQPEDVPVPDHPQPAEPPAPEPPPVEPQPPVEAQRPAEQPAAPPAPAPQADGPRSREKKAPSTRRTAGRRTAGGDGRTDRPRRERKRTSESPGDGSLRRGGSPDEDRSAPRPWTDVAAAPHNPGFIDLLPGPSTATGVPNFIIREFRVPPFLLPIYQAAGIEYGIRWEILAAINEIETDYGRNLTVSSAGAVGWMQFMPPTWAAYGTDANQDGRSDPYNPVDAIFAAARYLKAANYETDVRAAIWAYNHADWYVDTVLLRAREIAAAPAALIGSLTGLAEGRFPIPEHARSADDLPERQLLGRRSIAIFARYGAPVVAANDGVVERVGLSEGLGRYIRILDVYGNRYTYAHLESTADRLEPGSRVVGGAVVGHVGETKPGTAAHLNFTIRPAGRGVPRIDPKPILDGWKLLEATAVHRSAGENVLGGGASIGQILLLPKPLLAERVLADERIEIYGCGRDDIRSGRIDRRVLATLAYLAESGLSPTVTSLTCGHGYYTSSGNVSHHSSGNAVDIAMINGVPILGHQEPGGITDQTVKRLAQLQGVLAPTQIISLLDLGGPTLAMSDHHDHIHVGFQPMSDPDEASGRALSVLRPRQWPKLVDRLGEIENPIVPAPSQPR